ncbi:hypothetical protein PsorP6_014187 [Peronosclerospora sorghi]|uniref:Uncharacterized protein n=1 Tax=Peronosclerospora sorghi TaxID=230839 RepID=A0ACC0VIB3_9STRA|nr:hypothetical protein PsorP6_014187 [Peronosclerospora sorghi]
MGLVDMTFKRVHGLTILVVEQADQLKALVTEIISLTGLQGPSLQDMPGIPDPAADENLVLSENR